MGIDRRGLEALLWFTRRTSLGKAATAGRQSIHFSQATFESTTRRFGRPLNFAQTRQPDGYCETLLRLLGADEISSFDANTYEGATEVIDLNYPVGAEKYERYDTVLDFGTIEHVFNISCALDNYVRMLKPGGWLLCLNPANNHFGHGFHQLSAEFWYGFFRQNGFESAQVFVAPSNRGGPWFRCPDPEEIRNRVTLRSSSGVYVIANARKSGREASALVPPTQADYVAAWGDRSENRPPKPRRTWHQRITQSYAGLYGKYLTPFEPSRDRPP